MVTRMRSEIEGVRRFLSPYAPRFHVLAARLKIGWTASSQGQVYISGKGVTRDAAERRLLGEAVERASLISVQTGQPWAAVDPVTNVVREIRSQDYFGAELRVNTHGTAAHNIAREAKFRAILELCERHAVEDWWSARTPTRWVSREICAELGLHTWEATWREGAIAERKTAYLLLSSPACCHVAAAVSRDPSGDRPAVGFAAGTTPVSAFRQAFEELLSVELETADLVRCEMDGDRIVPGSNRDRARSLQNRLKRFFAEAGTAISDPDEWCDSRSTDGDPISLAKCLSAHGLPLFLSDITSVRIGVPVWRAFFQDPEKAPFRTASELAPL